MAEKSTVRGVIKRFVRWLARREIEAAQEAGVAKGMAIATAAVPHMRSMAYAEGEVAGADFMHASIAAAVRERLAGDYVLPEDLARAKKGMIH